MNEPNLEYPQDYDIKLTVYHTEPLAQQRHRSCIMQRRNTGRMAEDEKWFRLKDLFIHNYDPSATDKRDFLRMVAASAPRPPVTGPLRVDVFLFWPYRKGDYRTGKYARQLKPGVSPWKDTGKDRDNCDKLVLDALTGTFWINDSQVADGRIVKRYTEGKSRTEIYITELQRKEQNHGKEKSLFEEDHDNGKGEPAHGSESERQDIVHGDESIW